jgi:predicted small lipoprotein YifL
MVGPKMGVGVSSGTNPLARIAVLGMLVAALAGCGRKAALDPPPSAALTGEAGKAGPGGGPPDSVGIDEYGRPVAPPAGGQKKSLPILDWLVD